MQTNLGEVGVRAKAEIIELMTKRTNFIFHRFSLGFENFYSMKVSKRIT